MAETEIKRCVIYTRKSTDKGLEQDYNSLDAQRESAENFIKSQKPNGWQLLPEHYDDGGYSGGTTERPALKRLMSDIEAGGIDVIVVYKLDRLSRSLLDFMTMAEFFEQHNVSVISVTQDINTSTSSGRMMLNILMTFCQFEREILVERIKDKIAGAKRRGKYCGGCPVIGYDVNHDTKKLVINKKEAELIREIFKSYTKVKYGREVARLLNEKGYHTKSWVSKKGVHHTGMKFTPKGIYRILNNPLYIGKIQHNDNVYEGEQEAIISRSLWDKTQQLLRNNMIQTPGQSRNKLESPFKGLLYCGYCGGSFGITYTMKNKRRYMYYICTKNEARAERSCPLSRFSTNTLDRVILNQLTRLFKTPTILVRTFKEIEKEKEKAKSELQKRESQLEKEIETLRTKINAGIDAASLRQEYADISSELEDVKHDLKGIGEIYSTDNLFETCESIDAVWDQLFPAERYHLAHTLLDKVTIFTDHILLDIKHFGLKSLIRELSVDSEIQISPAKNDDIIQLNIPVQVKRWNGRKIIIAPSENGEPDYEEDEFNPITKRLAQAHRWLEMIDSGEYPTIARLAEGYNLDPSNLMKALKMTTLSPKIQRMIMSGDSPNTMKLTKFYSEFPEDWEAQEQHFGMKEETVL